MKIKICRPFLFAIAAVSVSVSAFADGGPNASKAVDGKSLALEEFQGSDKAAKKLFAKTDRTHHNIYGAMVMARFVMNELVNIHQEFKPFFNEKYAGFDPANPPKEEYVPASGELDLTRPEGGKGPWADDYGKFPGNGPSSDVLVENCTFRWPTHSALTLGSECPAAPELISFADGVTLRNNVVEAEKVKEVVWRSDVFRIANLVFEGNKVNGKDVE